MTDCTEKCQHIMSRCRTPVALMLMGPCDVLLEFDREVDIVRFVHEGIHGLTERGMAI